MAGYADTRQMIIDTLMGRMAGTEIQPEDHQKFALQITDYIRSVELVAGNATPIGFADANIVPVQPDNGQAVYLSSVGGAQTVTFTNFIDQNGNAISVTSTENVIKLVTLLWNGQYWSSQVTSVNAVRDTTNGYLFMGVATPSTDPGTPDQKVFYIGAYGTYPYFDGIKILKNEIAILKYNTSWTKEIVSAVADIYYKEHSSFVNQNILKLFTEYSQLAAISVEHGFLDNDDNVITIFPDLKHSTFSVQPSTIYKMKSVYFAGGDLYVLRYLDSNNSVIARDFYIQEHTLFSDIAFVTPSDCVKIVVNHSVNECSIYALTAIENFDKINELTQIRDILQEEVVFNRTSTVLGFYSNDGVLNTAFDYYYVDYYSVDSGKEYQFKSLMNGSGIDCVHFFDANNNYIGHIFPVDGEMEYTGSFITPAGTKKIAINRNNNICDYTTLTSFIWYSGNIGQIDARVKLLESASTKIKCLFIGNSLNQDNIGYLPWLLKNTYPGLTFEIYICYIGGYTIKEYVENVINGTHKIDIFSVAQNTEVWTNYEYVNYNYSDIFTNYGPFDLISYQGFGYFEGEDSSYFVQFVNDLFNRQNTPFKLGYLLCHNWYGDAAWERLMQDLNTAILTTPVDIVFAPGVAVELVKNDFQESFLTPDGLHSNQGLPSILGAYSVMDKIAKSYSLPSKILNNQLRITQAIEDTLHVPGPNGTLKIGTDAQYIICQKAAIQSNKYIDAVINNMNINIL